MFGLTRRFVKFNGAVSIEQLSWLDDVLQKSDESHEVVLVASLLFLRVINSIYSVALDLLTYCLGDAQMARNGSYFRILLQVALSCACLLYTSPSPRDGLLSRMPSSA